MCWETTETTPGTAGTRPSASFGGIQRIQIFRRAIVPKVKKSRFWKIYYRLTNVKTDDQARAVVLDRVKKFREKEREMEKAKKRAAKEARRHGG